MVIEYCCT